MADVLPEGEAVRRALRWIAAEREADPERPLLAVLDEAMLRFDLTPAQGEALLRQYRRPRDEASGP